MKAADKELFEEKKQLLLLLVPPFSDQNQMISPRMLWRKPEKTNLWPEYFRNMKELSRRAPLQAPKGKTVCQAFCLTSLWKKPPWASRHQ